MGQKQHFTPRSIALLGVLALHALLLIPLMRLYPWRATALPPESAMEVFWIEPSPALATDKTSRPVRPRSKVLSPRSPLVDRSNALPPEPITEPPHIDWNAQLGEAAQDYVRQQEEEA